MQANIRTSCDATVTTPKITMLALARGVYRRMRSSSSARVIGLTIPRSATADGSEAGLKGALFLRGLADLRRPQHDRSELAQPLLLFLDQELRVTDNVDEKDMSDFKAKILV